MVARLAAPKRPDTVIRAFGQAKLGDCELVIAGEGPMRGAMQALADAVAARPGTPAGQRRRHPALLASAQIFVLASDHEELAALGAGGDAGRPSGSGVELARHP